MYLKGAFTILSSEISWEKIGKLIIIAEKNKKNLWVNGYIVKHPLNKFCMLHEIPVLYTKGKPTLVILFLKRENFKKIEQLPIFYLTSIFCTKHPIPSYYFW